MLVAFGLLTATASALLYAYLTKKQIPVLHVIDDGLDSKALLSEPVNFTPESARNDSKGQRVDQEAEDGTPEPSPDTTPKQKPQDDRKLMRPPPLMNGGLKVSSMPSSMPPPPRPVPQRLKPSATLRPPPSQASTLRAPPTHKPLINSALAPSISTLPPSARPSKKVILQPGHSPLDWAYLTKSPPSRTYLRGSDVPMNLIRVTPSLLRAHNGRKGVNAWGVFGGRVYNVTPYLDFHPGGRPELMRAAGNENGEKLFMEAHPWVSWDNMLSECCVGILVGEHEGEKNEMDEMD